MALGYGLKYLWGIANMLQFVIYLGLWQINIIPEAEVVIKHMKKLALFEFIDKASIVKFFLGDQDEDI